MSQGPGADAVRSLVLLGGRAGGETDALRQYSDALAGAIGDLGIPCRVETVAAPRVREDGDPRIGDVVRSSDSAVIVQYNPFSYGHVGIAPGLVTAIARLRRSRPDLRVVLMCHETIALTPGMRWRGVRQVHRLQLAALIRLSDVVFVSIGRWVPMLRRLGASHVARLPVGSNLPDRRAERDAVRRTLGATGRFVVASFSTGHPSHRDDYLVAALDAVLARRPDAIVLTLGAGRSPLMGSARVREVTPGFLDADELSGLLAASDLFVSPYVDGVSTRRGTVMAAFQHEVPVLATTGESTDSDLVGLLGASGVAFRAGPEAFAGRAAALVDDDVARTRLGRAGRANYEAGYDWPVIARAVRDAVSGARGSDRRAARRSA